MSTIKTKDGTQLYYKDWGQGPAVTFSHGWPLNADAWDGQMLFLARNGFRVVAHDRRGHGRSSQPSSGNDMNGYADDLAAVIEALDLKDVTVVEKSHAISAATGRSESPKPFSSLPCHRLCSKRPPIPRACQWRCSMESERAS